MKKIVYTLVMVAFACFLGTGKAAAQDFIYQAKNPAFGGDTFNYQWLQSSAQAQDKLKNPDELSRSKLYEDNPLEEFKKNLNRQILNQLARQLLISQFGTDGITPGSYTIGTYKIDVTEDIKGLNVVIFDSATGDRTSVTIPHS